ncbi:hypothetical protein VTJ83DRAFT_732 [Remersonia thermophila]|uniref:Uncharacterized protein n=1 Tax=Remersonia thermophila TaxID=72144 RepID=A0ABR4DMF1_9PEZI
MIQWKLYGTSLVLYIFCFMIPIVGNIIFLASGSREKGVFAMTHVVHVPFLAESLNESTGAGPDANRDAGPLVPPKLPTVWVFGLSVAGVCDNFTDIQEIHCRRRFLPSNGILTLLEDSLRHSFRRRGGDQDIHNRTQSDSELVKAVLTSWNKTLDRHNLASGIVAHRDKLDAVLRASAGCAIALAILDLVWFVVTVQTLAKGLATPVLSILNGGLGIAVWALADRAYDLGTVLPPDMNAEWLEQEVFFTFMGGTLRVLFMAGMVGYCCVRAIRAPKRAAHPTESAFGEPAAGTAGSSQGNPAQGNINGVTNVNNELAADQQRDVESGAVWHIGPSRSRASAA